MACALVDDSFGADQALRAVWMSGGQQNPVAHRSPTLLNLSPTGHTGLTKLPKLAISYFREMLS